MINGVNEMSDRMNGITSNGITSNTTNSLLNIMSDLEVIIKIGVHIIYEELVKILRVVMRFLNDIDVSSPMGLHKKNVVNEVEMVGITSEMIKEDDINFERNRYGFPRGITSENVHFPKDISRTEFFNE